jgi:hypothetical protein
MGMPDGISAEPHGLIVMCMHCRRTLRKTSEGETWELIEQYLVQRPDNVSDGICRDCLVKHYPEHVKPVFTKTLSTP